MNPRHDIDKVFSGTQVAALVESFRNDICIIAEDQQAIRKDIAMMKEDIHELKTDMVTVKDVLRIDIPNLRSRIEALEALKK